MNKNMIRTNSYFHCHFFHQQRHFSKCLPVISHAPTDKQKSNHNWQ